MAKMVIFGMGYSAQVLAARLRALGWVVSGTGRAGDMAFADSAAVRKALQGATHILSSVPPDAATGGDPVLATYGADIVGSSAEWIGYLSSTGVYGDTGGAWVDESAPIGTGRRRARADADLGWQRLDPRVRVFRLPGIYGPGRSPLDRVLAGHAHRIDLPDQIFSRIHVDDIAGGVIASFTGPAGVYNLADDCPASQNAVIEQACHLLDQPVPPLLALDEAGLSPAARAFYAENRRVANGRARRVLGWSPRYPTYQEGLRALNATISPTSASTPPEAASKLQR